MMILMQIFLHLDQHLAGLVASYGIWIYACLFLVIFCETGLIIMPFLPGDSLLFVAGALTASAAGQTAGLNIHTLVVLLSIAAVLGDSVNYTIGRKLGHKLFSNPQSKIFRQDHLARTEAFYQRHGGKTIIIARFTPIIRTFAPFVAGIGEMHYPRFFLFNFIGALVWVVSFAYAGYFLGNIEWVKHYLNVLIIAIIVISFSPAIIAMIRRKWGKPKK
jgi:membrane-associated protein